jgi:cytochrome c biogenesis protein CcmG/thiol:disulfide interchange protein DsbE
MSEVRQPPRVLGLRLMLGVPPGRAGGGGWRPGDDARANAEGRVRSFDPHSLPSKIIGRKVPDFTLPGLDGRGFTGDDLQTPKQSMLVNFFASWCAPCLQESVVLAQIAKLGLPIWGITYKDAPGATRAFLAQNGNPYARIAQDGPGRVAIDWGVYGVPETYFIDARGIVRWRYAGALTDAVVQRDVVPLLYRAEKSAA